jgi:hypothetical protein
MELGTAKRKAPASLHDWKTNGHWAQALKFAVQTVQSIDDGPYVLFCAQPTIHE